MPAPCHRDCGRVGQGAGSDNLKGPGSPLGADHRARSANAGDLGPTPTTAGPGVLVLAVAAGSGVGGHGQRPGYFNFGRGLEFHRSGPKLRTVPQRGTRRY